MDDDRLSLGADSKDALTRARTAYEARLRERGVVKRTLRLYAQDLQRLAELRAIYGSDAEAIRAALTALG